ncbi:AraC family transcriptional regulator [Streptomonospora sp. S1-112]|uniref:AraC family transcriptional regulator n=1 Tax=Streptomonospora mangrovi TaxID=2883123 RepID=A0A9X3SLG9_9ACTN|nr:AraC family transcriptional regulator [Streptomonospora mangrovi]MDA0563366.1 AraC family transcriptional regulator [Streptomonospora mangrovi]
MLDRLNQALEHIEEDPARPVDVAAMARTALTSEHHLRRMFAALAGMGLAEYARRRRLTLAGAEVMAGDRPLLDIAVAYGYSSAEAFTRAFHSVHGITPGQARRTGAALVSQSRLAFRLTVEGSTQMRYRILDKDAFALVGPRTRIPTVAEGPNPDMIAFTEAVDDATWQRLEELSDQEPRGALSVSVALEEGGDFGEEIDYYVAAATTAPTPEGMERLEVPATTWAVFPFERVGFPHGLQALWRAVYTEWFPAHPGYRTAPGPALVAVADEQEPDLGSGHLWLPVEKQGPGTVPGGGRR